MTEKDAELLIALHEAELAARDLYQMTLDSDSESDPDKVAVASLLREHHRAYAQSISGVLGKQATNKSNAALVAKHEAAFGSSKWSTAAFELENFLVATHSAATGVLEGPSGAALVASIIITEARHAVVVGELAGIENLDIILATPAAK